MEILNPNFIFSADSILNLSIRNYSTNSQTTAIEFINMVFQ